MSSPEMEILMRKFAETWERCPKPFLMILFGTGNIRALAEVFFIAGATEGGRMTFEMDMEAMNRLMGKAMELSELQRATGRIEGMASGMATVMGHAKNPGK